MKKQLSRILGLAKKPAVVCGLAGLVIGCASPTAPVAQVPCPPSVTPPAGKFEMHNYVMVFLRRGPAWSPERTPEVEKIGEGHMAHIRAMGETGKMLLAGPFEIEGTPPNAIAGILLFDGVSVEEARSIASDDPAVKAGRFTLDVFPWYGPKGITFPGKEEPRAKPKSDPLR